VNSLFICNPGSGSPSNNSSVFLNGTQFSMSSLELNKFKSIASRSGSISCYTIPRSGVMSERDRFEIEENKDHVVDGKFSDENDGNGFHRINQTKLTQTNGMIFEDHNPVKNLMKGLIPLCFEVKHSKF